MEDMYRVGLNRKAIPPTNSKIIQWTNKPDAGPTCVTHHSDTYVNMRIISGQKVIYWGFSSIQFCAWGWFGLCIELSRWRQSSQFIAQSMFLTYGLEPWAVTERMRSHPSPEPHCGVFTRLDWIILCRILSVLHGLLSAGCPWSAQTTSADSFREEAVMQLQHDGLVHELG